MAMDLAEAAHAQALRDAKPPPEAPRPARAGMPAYMPPPSRAAYDRTLASNFFQEFSHCARQAILLEARLDSGAYDNAPAIPNFTEQAAPKRETPHGASTGPHQPSDETRIHHERLEDEGSVANTGDPETILQTVAENLEASIAQARAAGLDLSPNGAHANTPSQSPDIASLRRPEPARDAAPCPAVQASTQTQARPRASPRRSQH